MRGVTLLGVMFGGLFQVLFWASFTRGHDCGAGRIGIHPQKGSAMTSDDVLPRPETTTPVDLVVGFFQNASWVDMGLVGLLVLGAVSMVVVLFADSGSLLEKITGTISGAFLGLPLSLFVYDSFGSLADRM